MYLSMCVCVCPFRKIGVSVELNHNEGGCGHDLKPEHSSSEKVLKGKERGGG